MGGSAGTWVRLQALAVAVVVSADGIVAWLLGAPAWIAVLYAALGVAFGYLRVRLARKRPSPPEITEPAVASPQRTQRRAIGYVCIPSAANGELRAQSETL